MKKFDNKGFALVETLVVSVFVVSLFLIVFNNFYPLMSEYEKREVYDDVDGVYAAYWIGKLIEDKANFISETSDCGDSDMYCINPNSDPNSDFNRPLTSDQLCHKFTIIGGEPDYKSDPDGNAIQKWQKKCYGIFEAYGIRFVYLTNYELTDFKSMLSNGSIPKPSYNLDLLENENYFTKFEDYVNSLPDYSNAKNNTYGSNYRVILSMRRKGDKWYWGFSNVEVKR